MKKYQAHLLSLLVFAVVLILGSVVYSQLAQRRLLLQRTLVGEVTTAHAGNLQRELDRALSATHELAAVLRQGEGTIADFDRLAQEMIDAYGGISSLQLAPDGIVSQVYPLAGNEEALGHHLLQDPNRRADVLAAIGSRQLSLNGPVDLLQGGSGIMGQLPIFLLDKQGEETFWGLTIVLIRLDKLFADSNLTQLDQNGYVYELSQPNPTGGQPTVVAATDPQPLIDPVTVDIQLPTGSWTLSVMPQIGWGVWPYAGLEYILIWLAAILLGLLTFGLLETPTRPRREVVERTRQLTQVNQELATENTMRRQTEAALIQAKEEAEEANQAKSLFLANMSHELRTPLNAILGYSELMAEDAADQELVNFVADLGKIHRAGETLLNMINDILDLAKLDAGRVEISIEPIHLNSLIQDLVTFHQPTLQANHNRLELNLAQDVGAILTDGAKVQQVLTRLLSNAAKFTQNGIVTVTTRREASAGSGGPQVIVLVADTGIGISPAQQRQLFTPLTQGDDSSTKRYAGIGLGLAISYRYVQLLGGELTVQSEEGVGSLFTVRIPTGLPTQDPTRISEPARYGGQEGSQDLVLVIDDDSTAQELLQRLLEQEGFQVMTAGSGSEGLALARQHQPNVITLDMQMPGMNGLAVLTHLKEDAALAAIPVVLITILDQSETGVAIELADHLRKPIDREELVRLLRRYCRPNAGPPLRILMVEDDTYTRKSVREILASSSDLVFEAENGRLGLQMVAQVQPDIILLDLLMPEMDGFQFVAALRQQEGGAQLPVVVMTGKDLGDAERTQLQGMVERIIEKGSHYRAEVALAIQQILSVNSGSNERVEN